MGHLKEPSHLVQSEVVDSRNSGVVQLDQAGQVIGFGRTDTRTGYRIHGPCRAAQQAHATDLTLGSNP